MTKTRRQKEMQIAIEALTPFIPYADAQVVREKANAPHLRKLPANIAIFLALTSYVRHTYTGYEDMLDQGLDRDAARYCVAEDMAEKIEDWGGSITAEELLAEKPTSASKSET